MTLITETLDRPYVFPVYFSGIPDELKIHKTWVMWRLVLRGQTDGTYKWTKPPFMPSGKLAKVNDPKTWCSYEEAKASYEKGGFDGIGIVVTPELCIVGLDHDNCINSDGETSQEAIDFFTEANTYCEYSPSGNGLRGFAFGKLPQGGKRKGKIEMYDSGHYLTVTGRLYDITNNNPDWSLIQERYSEMASLYAKYIGNSNTNKPQKEASMVVPLSPSVGIQDSQLIDKILRSKKGLEFERLWAGPGADHSSDDLSLCNRLAFWTAKDAVRMDRLFRQSGLMRDKWDETHSSDGRTYGEMTIDKAISGTSAVYTDRNNNNHEGVKNNRLRLIPVAELLANRTSPSWLIKDWFPNVGLIMIHGDPGSGKSFIAIDIALHIATGMAWRGCKVEQGGVVYLAGEGHAGIKTRTAAWLQTNQINIEDSPLYVSSTGGELSTKEGLNDVIKAIDEINPPPKMIVVDTLHRWQVGDENSAEDAGNFIRSCDKLVVRYDCDVMLIHHQGHGDKTRSRGSSAWRGALDAEFRTIKSPSGISLTCTKMKESEEPKPLGWELKKVLLDDWFDSDGNQITNAVLSPIDSPKRSGEKAPSWAKGLIKALVLAGGILVPLAKWRDVFYSKHTGENQEAKKKAFQKRAGLVDLGVITVNDDIYSIANIDYWPDLGEIVHAP